MRNNPDWTTVSELAVQYKYTVRGMLAWLKRQNEIMGGRLMRQDSRGGKWYVSRLVFKESQHQDARDLELVTLSERVEELEKRVETLRKKLKITALKLSGKADK